jgi:hypothetical protein
MRNEKEYAVAGDRKKAARVLLVFLFSIKHFRVTNAKKTALKTYSPIENTKKRFSNIFALP